MMPTARSAPAIATAMAGDRAATDAVIHEFLENKAASAQAPTLLLFVDLLREFLDGGKRLRPLLCCCGWRAAGGRGDHASVIRIAASLELFHTFGLIHDDVMDASDTRRGRPTVHRRMASAVPARSDERFGVNTAILTGDLAFGWSYELLHDAGLPPAVADTLWQALDRMRTDTLVGQYLDLLHTGSCDADIAAALTIARFKTGKYTVEHPLRLGAIVAGATPEVLSACSAFGIPLGEAFQLRDDLLGVFGDPARTGKADVDDLRDGKPTALLAAARTRSTDFQRHRLDAIVGNPSITDTEAAEAREIIRDTGAVEYVEELIAQRLALSSSVVESGVFDTDGAEYLRYVASLATRRDN
ncbi:polyprenyl synthetase family protein [Nocardia colli]|nr:polyprenyl synthetase family protein [Nocardia colli]